MYYRCNIFHCTFIRFNFNNGCILKWASKFPENSILSSCEPECIQSDTPRCKSVAPGEMQPELMHQPRLLPTRVQSGPLGHPDLSLTKSIFAFMLSHLSLSLFSIFQKNVNTILYMVGSFWKTPCLGWTDSRASPMSIPSIIPYPQICLVPGT